MDYPEEAEPIDLNRKQQKANSNPAYNKGYLNLLNRSLATTTRKVNKSLNQRYPDYN